jgi:Na+/proline symporter
LCACGVDLRGIMVAAILAAVISTLDQQVIA